MKIPVVGFDPSYRNWGIAEGVLDLKTGYLTNLSLSITETEKSSSKQVRKNSDDLARAQLLADAAITAAKKAKVVFVEVPHGSQSASSMKSMGICIGILASIEALGIPIVQVSANEVKKTFTGKLTATKDEMIQTAVSLYPEAVFPNHRGRITSKAEHVADAIAAIHAGVQTPMFKNLMRLYAEV